MDNAIVGLLGAIDKVIGASAPVTSSRQAETERLIEQLCGVYLETDAAGRSAIREFMASRQDGNFWLMHEFAHQFAERVTGPDASRMLRLGLAAVSIEDCGLDSRDTQMILAKLYSKAKQARLDPQPMFEEVAALSTDSRTPGGCDSVAEIIRQAARNGAMTE